MRTKLRIEYAGDVATVRADDVRYRDRAAVIVYRHRSVKDGSSLSQAGKCGFTARRSDVEKALPTLREWFSVSP